ncbi:MAG: bifunctional folylpolyglutamate synthase/dihydrofolate synthase [Clostridiales bacterium]|nr:bifunctional folylpolyglutamate synthase/dihydrofolate synthase [Clostridiales bacterium]
MNNNSITMQEAVDFLYDLPKFTKKNSLDHTRKLLAFLGDPCFDRKIIHVAGSNGKGSVCCFLYHMLLCSGKSATMFTSPHLVDIRERFQVNGKMVEVSGFLEAFELVKAVSEEMVKNNLNHPTFFEFIFAMGMVIFEKAQAEYIVLETGLGGRLDATNSFPRPVLTVITSISLEHTEILGDTLAQIAAEKAGILKPGVPLVFWEGEPEAAEVIRSRAAELGCPQYAISNKNIKNCEIKEEGIDFSFSTAYDRTEKKAVSDQWPGSMRTGQARNDVRCQPLGDVQVHLQSDAWDDRMRHDGKSHRWTVPGHACYQAENAALAIEAMHVLDLADDDGIQQGLTASVWPGRMQEVLPEIYFDGAHNPSGIEAFVQSVRLLAADDPCPPLLLFSMVKEKDLRTAVRLLTSGCRWESVAVTTVKGERGVPAESLRQLFSESSSRPLTYTVDSFDDCGEAFRVMQSRKKPGQKLFCTGSLYFIGELMKERSRYDRFR